MFSPVTRPCRNCQKVYTHTFLGNRCASCKVTNWKYQSYVIPMAIMLGIIIAMSAVLLVLTKF